MQHLWFIILPVIVFVVSCTDLYATLHFNKTHKDFNEANPIARYIWDTHGEAGLVAFKLSVTSLSCCCMGMVLKKKNRRWRVSVSIFGLLGCFRLIGWWIFWFLAATAV